MRRFAASLALLLPAFAAGAEEQCWQENAVYSDPATNAELKFLPPESDADGSFARFTITFPENAIVLDGVVMDAGEPFFRPLGIIMHKCPTGDVTGAELDACTIWQGIVYGLDGVGNAPYLAPMNEGSQAARTLLFPDLRASVRLSSVWGASGLSTPPNDDFKFKACAG
ncbi:MAG: hypothetical protein MUC58_11120 [Rhizobiaceae bacterium]|jgi:hypothetical protein|nr:hypothetical protein [Rhizobiaceae bacterium]